MKPTSCYSGIRSYSVGMLTGLMKDIRMELENSVWESGVSMRSEIIEECRLTLKQSSI